QNGRNPGGRNVAECRLDTAPIQMYSRMLNVSKWLHVCISP
ncbi:hypothetical protein CCACVL1_19001, partial [Corchorus capsularis]